MSPICCSTRYGHYFLIQTTVVEFHGRKEFQPINGGHVVQRKKKNMLLLRRHPSDGKTLQPGNVNTMFLHKRSSVASSWRPIYVESLRSSHTTQLPIFTPPRRLLYIGSTSTADSNDTGSTKFPV